MLSGEDKIRKELNLTSSDYNKRPYDFYSFVVELYNDYLNNIKEENFKKDE